MPSPTAFARVRLALDAMETELLGRKALSFDRAASRDGWAPEPIGDACWRCARGVGPHEVDGDGCAACRGEKLSWDRAVRLGPYDDEVIRDAVLGLKFNAWRTTGSELGRALGHRVLEHLALARIRGDEAAIVPVPMPTRRRLVRGVDHTLALARAVARVTGCRVVRPLAARHRQPQVGLSATARAENIRGGFRWRWDTERTGRELGGVRSLLVLDDVLTTGSTLSRACFEASGALRGVCGSDGTGPAVWAVCAAAARGTGRRAGRGSEIDQEV